MGYLGPQACKHVLGNIHVQPSVRLTMNIQELDLNGGTFKVNLPYNWVGWLLWAIGLIITLIGFFVAINDTNALVVAAFGLLMMAFTSPGSLESNLNDVRQSAIDPAELEAKAEASGLSIDNWWMSQTSYVPTTDPSDWILPAPGPMSWNNDDRYGPHGDGSALPEHPSKVGTPIPATMTLFTVYCILAIACILIAAAALMTGGEYDGGMTPAIAIAAIGLILSLVGYFKSKMLRQMIDTPTSLVRSAPVRHPWSIGLT